MRLAGVAAALAVLAACNPLPPPRDGVRAVDFDLDPRFGVEVGELPITRSGTVAFNAKSGRAWFGAWLDAGRDEDGRDVEDEFLLWSWDPEDPEDVEEIEPPDLVSRSFDLYHALDPEKALVVEFGDVPLLYAWDGEGWFYVDAAPGFDHAGTTYVMLSEDRIFAGYQGAIAVWNGAMWLPVAAPAGSVLGPVARDAFRTVHPGGPCTIRWEFATLQGGAPVCGAQGASPSGIAMNGTLDAFFASDGGRAWRFADGAWSTDEVARPGFAPAVTTAPGVAVWSVSDGAYAFPALHRLDSTFTEQTLVPAFSAAITCGCDRAADPECACANPSVEWSDTAYEIGADALDLALLVEHQGRRVLTTRRFVGPLGAAPFSDADVP